ncbi:hypothetical protein [Brevibacterium sediminis]|uniref:Uncharacterized protein n=1 Tax=Brevibacterium sediminis TaxID=1857024 RepID=A0A5C4X2W0_9MICO|nr:hypothetical protein [Brevibacterium sediminis]TNM55898.1 hypothetical protein FHQ09_06570 [Brevibacterium sediminis]
MSFKVSDVMDDLQYLIRNTVNRTEVLLAVGMGHRTFKRIMGGKPGDTVQPRTAEAVFRAADEMRLEQDAPVGRVPVKVVMAYVDSPEGRAFISECRGVAA